MSVYDLVYNKGCYWDKRGVSCTVGDYVIVESQDTYRLVQVEALTATTGEYINQLTKGHALKRVVANSTETIRHFENENRGL